MAITFNGSTLYVSQAEPTANGTVSGFSGSSYTNGYMTYSSDKYYPVGYSAKTYVVRLNFHTSVPITSFSLDITAGPTENTSKTYKHRMVVSTDSTYGTLSASDFATKTPYADIHFSSGSYTTVTLTCSVAIPAGNFYVYIGPNSNNISNNKYSLLFAKESTSSYNKFAYTATNAASYTISYDANGGSGTTDSQTKYAGYSIALRSNGFSAPASTTATRTITLKVDGTTSGTKKVRNTTPKVFNKWNTAADGTGTSYAAGATYSGNAALKLYAQWKNGKTTYGTTTLGTATKSPTSAALTLTLRLQDGLDMTYPLTKTTNYTFSNWNTNSSGTGTAYDSTTAYQFTANTTLHAIFTSNTILPSVELPINITRDGYTFAGWSTSASGTPLLTDTVYHPSQNTTLYAVWSSSGLEEGMYIYRSSDKTWHKVAAFTRG